MKGYSLRNEKLKKITNITVFFAVIILIGVLLPRIFSFVGSLIMTPVHTINQWYETSEHMVPVWLRDREELQNQIADLENDVIVSQGEAVTLARLQDENNRLRALLKADVRERTVAKVIARPADMPYDLLQIDRGSDAGIKENTLVYVGADQLVGRVSQVRPTYSFVQLFSSPGVEMTGFVSGPDVVATIEGVGGGVARIRVPQGIPLTVGDVVYVPSIQPGVFGQIDYVENRPSQPEQFGYITAQQSLQSLHEVAVAATELPQATVESIEAGKEQIIAERLLVEEAHTISFEELLATSTPTSTESVTE